MAPSLPPAPFSPMPRIVLPHGSFPFRLQPTPWKVTPLALVLLMLPALVAPNHHAAQARAMPGHQDISAQPDPARTAQDAGDDWLSCRAAVAAAEQAHGIPGQLLAAVSLAESGRWHAPTRESLAWPWTVTSGQRSWYLPSKAEAIARVEALRREGIRNIDVGCLQINLHHHPDAFADLEAAFDPETNAAYGAAFLARLQARHRSWSRAISFYHSATPALHTPYRIRVMQLWNQERRRESERRRKETIAAFEARRSERLAETRPADQGPATQAPRNPSRGGDG